MRPSDRPAQPEQLQLSFSRYLNIEQVADILGVPKSFIYRRTARGHSDPIPHYRIGGHLRFKLEDVEAWVEIHRSEPQASPASMVAAVREASRPKATQQLKQIRRRGNSR